MNVTFYYFKEFTFCHECNMFFFYESKFLFTIVIQYNLFFKSFMSEVLIYVYKCNMFP